MNEAIQILCDKFGTTAENLISTMSQYYKISTIVETTIWGIVAIGCFLTVVLTLRHEFKKSKEDNYYDVFDNGWAIFVVTAFGIFGIIGVVSTLCGIHGCVMANVTPEAYTIQQILNSLK